MALFYIPYGIINSIIRLVSFILREAERYEKSHVEKIR
jgi:hypothetical protein